MFESNEGTGTAGPSRASGDENSSMKKGLNDHAGEFNIISYGSKLLDPQNGPAKY